MEICYLNFKKSILHMYIGCVLGMLQMTPPEYKMCDHSKQPSNHTWCVIKTVLTLKVNAQPLQKYAGCVLSK